MPVSRVQSAIAEGATASATFGATPTAGNLLVAITFHRGAAGTTASISGSGWTKRVERTTSLGDINVRRGLAVFTKVAGPSEPTNIQTSWSPAQTNKLIIQELVDSAGRGWEFLDKADNDNGGVNATSLATGTTSSVEAGNLVLVTALGIRNGGFVNITSASWNNMVGSTVHSDGGDVGRTVNSGFGEHTISGTKSSTASWTGTNSGASAAILVFKLVSPTMSVSRVQSAVAEATTASATFGATPTPGNLLVAITFHRSTGSTASIVGDGWTKRVERTTSLGDIAIRRGLTVYTKVAGPSEPRNIQTSWNPSTLNKLIIQEFADSQERAWEFLEKADNDNGGANATSLASGTTASVAAGDLVLITALGIRNGGFTEIASASWNNGVANTVHSNGGDVGRTVNSGYGEHTASGTKSSTATWTGANSGASASILVFNLMTVPPQDLGMHVGDAPEIKGAWLGESEIKRGWRGDTLLFDRSGS